MANYETREQYMNAFVDYARDHFERIGSPLPSRIRVSIGFTSVGGRGKAIGECWNDVASADGHFEIFIAPTNDDAAKVAEVLTHELVHAAVGLAARHGPKFKACANALGLVGPMRATTASADWFLWALPILDELGPMPYAPITSGESTRKPKQKTNLLKVECDQCGLIARITRKYTDAHDYLVCPIPECEGHLIIDADAA